MIELEMTPAAQIQLPALLSDLDSTYGCELGSQVINWAFHLMLDW